MKSTKPKIQIVQLVTPNIDNYAKYSIASILLFCKKNDFKLSLQRSNLAEDLHINWSKIQLLKNLLEKRNMKDDFIILVDADTILFDTNFDLISLIKKFDHKDCHIMMPQDDPTNPFKRNRPNAGFIILKNSKKGKEIVDLWLESARGNCSHLNDTHPRNQLVYWNCVMPKFINNQTLLPLKFFKKRSGFIHHFMKQKIGEREMKMMKFYGKMDQQKALALVSVHLEKENKGLIAINK